MKKLIRTIRKNLFRSPKKLFQFGLDILRYNSTLNRCFKSSLQSVKEKRFPIIIKDIIPCLNDKTETTGFDSHYVYHTAWAARMLAKTNPKLHIDISSSIYFVSIASAFIPIKFYDYRPAELELNNIVSEHADIISLPFEDNSIESLSCMHVVEHIGLGRYGDPIDPEGDLKAIKELKRVLKPEGYLLFVAPIGKQKLAFNAHRIYSFESILLYFSGFDLLESAIVADRDKGGKLVSPITKDIADRQDYGCGCFLFKKR